MKRAAPESRIVWVAGLRRSVFAGALAALARGVIDEVHELAGYGVRWSEILRRPPPGAFSTIIATEPKLRAAVLLRRIEHGVFISPAINFLYSDRRPAMPYPQSAYDQFRCLATLAVGRELDIDTRIDVGEENRSLAARLLPGPSAYIGFAPGSAGARKRWPLERFIELARRQREHRRVPVFFLGPGEASLKPEIESAVPDALFPEQAPGAAPKADALFVIALAERIAAGVANDAGGGHLLAAGRRPLISLFGHTSEHKFKPPYGERIAISAREYGGADIARIPVARVAAALDELLRRQPS